MSFLNFVLLNISVQICMQFINNMYFFNLQVPITIEVTVPNELHRVLAGQKRRELMQTYDVHILMPRAEENSDIVKVFCHKQVVMTKGSFETMLHTFFLSCYVLYSPDSFYLGDWNTH